MQTEESFDLFISYADSDHDWVEGYLLDALKAASVRTISEETFQLGVPHILEFERAIKQSKYTVLILSPVYFGDSSHGGGVSEFVDLLAQHYGQEVGTWPVIPLLLKDVQLPVRLSMLVPLDMRDPEHWDSAIDRLWQMLHRPPPGAAVQPICPYPGMIAFDEEQSAHFFGREFEVEALVQKLRHNHFAAVIGASGSGKSSLVFAGMLPVLRKSTLFGAGEWLMQRMRPGVHPNETLSALLGGCAAIDFTFAVWQTSQPTVARLLLIIDQFEELFSTSHSEQKQFAEGLHHLLQDERCYIVITARADFYADLMTCALWPKIQTHRLEIAPLGDTGLRQAIERPSGAVGVFVESALVERLVAGSLNQPGVLPILQEIMLRLWVKLERRFLPLRAYESLVLSYKVVSGSELTGLQVALAQLADEIISALSVDQQQIARRIFVRLVQFGEGRADTRRQQLVKALRVDGDESALFDGTLAHLVKNRLLTVSASADGERFVDLSHEAMLNGWPALQGWIAERREAELARRRLEGKAQEWLRLGGGDGGLLDAIELGEIDYWLANQKNSDVDVSSMLLQLVERSRTTIKQQHRREQHARWLRRAMYSVALLLIGAILSWFAIRQWMRLTTGSALVPIAGGSATIGSDNPTPETGEQPQRTVTLASFQIERYEVSRRQYKRCINFGPCSDPLHRDVIEAESLEALPIVDVNASQAQRYCEWIGRRLPTSVEWERAARGVEGRPWPWGNVLLSDTVIEALSSPTSVDTDPYTSTPPPEVLFHLAYNVSEWVIVSPINCKAATCQQSWDDESNLVGIIGGAYDRNIERIGEMSLSRKENLDQSIGFRCVASGIRN